MAYYQCEEEIEKDFNIVWGAIHKYGFDATEDIFQIGCIGLLKASRKFDPKKSKFTTFAYRCVANEICMHYRSKSRMLMENNSTSLDEMLESNMAKIKHYDESLEIESDLKDIVYQAINKVCSEENKPIFYEACTRRMNGETVTQTEIAQKYHISVTKVSRHLRKINHEVKKILIGEIK